MKRMKYLSILIFFIFFSCTNEKSISVGFLLPNLTDGRYPKDKSSFTERIKELGGSVEVGDAKNDPNFQEEQAKEMIKKGIKVLVISAVNQNTAASIVRDAHDKGVKVIAYERLIRNCDLDYFVSFDHYVVGKQQAGYAINKKGTGNYVLLGGDKGDRNAEMIHNGMLEILSPKIKSGEIKILYNIYVENWDKENAYMEMKKVLDLSGERVDAVLAANDGMAAGVIKALDEYHIANRSIITTGLDADADACKRIMEGKQSMTVYKPFKKEAQIAAELAIRQARGEDDKKNLQETWNGKVKVPTILLQSVVVDSTNINVVQ
ncbi:MAG: substrate-binding domain-containing protein [Bacteroidota bacterium]|nr:substrate-binding domain-containing protein [Bacteroidota bacterium]